MNQLLYSVYSWPNTVLALVGGILIDKILGIRRAMLLFVLLILSGSIVFAIGVQRTNYPLMLLGRIIFGFGGESLGVSQSTFIARWFTNKRGMALAFGITISFSRVGSSLSFLIAPMIAESKGIEAAVFSGVAVCGVSLVACALLIVADIYASRTHYIDEEVLGEEGFAAQLLSVRKMGTSFWLLCAICVFCYMGIFPFIGISKNFFQAKYGYTVLEASRYISFYLLTSAVCSPLIGLTVDSVGRNTWWIVASTAGFACIHACFLLSSIPAYVLMVVLGVVFSFLVSGLWPSVPLSVPIEITGIGYGVMTSLQNLGMACFSYCIGYVLDAYNDPSKASNSSSSSSNSASSESDSQSGAIAPAGVPQRYVYTQSMFIACTVISFLFSLWLLLSDVRSHGVLSLSRSQRTEWVAVTEEEEGQGGSGAAQGEDERDPLIGSNSTEPVGSTSAV